MIDVKTELSGDLLASIDKFEQAVKTNILRNGTQAAAQVFYDEAKARCPVSPKGHWFYGTHQKYWFEAGTLRDSIYQVYAKDSSGDDKQTYDVSWNHSKAPYGFMVEYGTSSAPAHSFMRPAYDAGKGSAGDAAIERMQNKMNALKDAA